MRGAAAVVILALAGGAGCGSSSSPATKLLPAPQVEMRNGTTVTRVADEAAADKLCEELQSGRRAWPDGVDKLSLYRGSENLVLCLKFG